MNVKIKNSEKAKAWQLRIEDQESSQLSIREYCLRNGLNKHTFCYWRKRLKSDKSKRFLPVNMTNKKPFVSTRIYLPNGVELELGDDLEKIAVNHLIKTLCGVGHVAS